MPLPSRVSKLPPPKFSEDDFVHILEPLDTGAASTWVVEGEDLSKVNGATDYITASIKSSTTHNHLRDAAEHSTNANTKPSQHVLCERCASQPQTTSRSKTPLSVLVTEKTVQLIPYLSYTNTIRHSTVWSVVEVLPPGTLPPQDSKVIDASSMEYIYKITPAEAVTAYVSESALAAAQVCIGTIVQKRSGGSDNEEDTDDEDRLDDESGTDNDNNNEYWVVTGLSVRGAEVWADIMDSDGQCEIVKVQELKMLPVREALRAIRG